MGVASVNRTTCQTVKKYEKGTYTFIEKPGITRTSEIAVNDFRKIEERPAHLDTSDNSWFAHTFQMNLKEEEVDPGKNFTA